MGVSYIVSFDLIFLTVRLVSSALQNHGVKSRYQCRVSCHEQLPPGGAGAIWLGDINHIIMRILCILVAVQTLF